MLRYLTSKHKDRKVDLGSVPRGSLHHGREDIAEQFTSQKQEHVAELVHITAKQKSENRTGSCQADIHSDPPATHNFLQPDPNSYMIHNLLKQHPLSEDKSSKHEPVRAISDSIHTTAQLALLAFEYLEHLNFDSVGSDHSVDGQSFTCHMPYLCEEVEEVGNLLGPICVSRLLVLRIKSGDSEVVFFMMTSDLRSWWWLLYDICNPRCSCSQSCSRGSFLPVGCPGSPNEGSLICLLCMFLPCGVERTCTLTGKAFYL